jgi:hypothetical protein
MTLGRKAEWPCRRDYFFQRLIRRFPSFQFNPLAISVAAEPRQLPFGELAGADFDKFNRFGQATFTAQMFRHLPVTDGLHGKFIFRQAVFQKVSRLPH